MRKIIFWSAVFVSTICSIYLIVWLYWNIYQAGRIEPFYNRFIVIHIYTITLSIIQTYNIIQFVKQNKNNE